MRQTTLTTCYMLCSILLFTSCNNEIPFDKEPVSENEQFVPEEDFYEDDYEITFIYNGVTYFSEYEVLPDSTLYYFDKVVGKVAEEIGKLPNLCAIVHENGIIEYLEDKKEVSIADFSESNPTTRATNGTMLVSLYKRAGCSSSGGWVIKHTNNYQEPQLTGKYNDDISSLSLEIWPYTNAGVDLVCYRDKNYGGESITFFTGGNGLMKPYFSKKVNNLKDYFISPTSTKTWNDRITSYKIKWKQ